MKMKYKTPIFSLLGVLLMCSAILKLFSVTYVSEVLFILLPVAWIDTFWAANLSLIVVVVSLSELLLGLLLMSQYKERVLPIVFSFLLLMLCLNIYQLYAGVEDCGCFGGWIQMPAGISFFKTSFLIVCTGYLMNMHQKIGSLIRLPIHQPQQK